MKSCVAKRWGLIQLLALSGLTAGAAAAQPLTKPQVANLIAKVENGVDQFRDYLEKRGDNATTAASTPQGQSRRSRRDAASDSTKAAKAGKDELSEALDELNQSTNRLRRKFDGTDTWMETKVQVERVMDDGRKINQVVARGNYGTEAARLWGILRNEINDLARAYGLQPMAI
jgi:hypothetical protein